MFATGKPINPLVIDQHSQHRNKVKIMVDSSAPSDDSRLQTSVPSEYPRNIYPASVDPMHFSHRATLLRAEELLGEEVHLVICLNAMKTTGVFSVAQRKNLAQFLLPGRKIFVATTKNEIRSFFQHCKHIVRGIRGQNDIEEMMRLVRYYKSDDWIDKLVKINVAEKYRQISSTRLKALIAAGNRTEAELCTHPEIVRALWEHYRQLNRCDGNTRKPTCQPLLPDGVHKPFANIALMSHAPVGVHTTS
eukprot:m.79754 g.79754  ORF g.79754 m.79754 type:complete len:248 (+) comp16290_c0_seq2:156-899(+)